MSEQQQALLEPNRDLLEQFVDAIFRHAVGCDGYVSVRAFRENDATGKAWRIQAVGVRDGLRAVIDAAEDICRRAANAPEPVVCCPPLALYASSDPNSQWRAREPDLLIGPALSIELDAHPRAALGKIVNVLGPPTVIVRSGGIWNNGNGESEPKLHVHWRLAAPARGPDLGVLKRVRRLATKLIGGDPTNIPIVHPIRWPGSWHRKREPVLCEIEALDPDREIALLDVLSALTTALGDGGGDDPTPPPPPADDPPRGHERADWAILSGNILQGVNLHDSTTRLAASLVMADVPPKMGVRMLRALMLNSAAPHDERWHARFNDCPRLIRDAVEKFKQVPPASPLADTLIQSSAQFVKDFQPPDYLIDGVLQRRFIYSFTGKTGSGKTAVTLLKAAHVGLGRPIGKLEVAYGRVLYFAGENPDDVRMRWIALAQRMDFDVNTIPVYFIPHRFKISALRSRIEQEIQNIGEIALVIIDTSAAYFEGDDLNNNVQAGAHASRLRALKDLPGGPCVLVNCHPVKNAAADNLLPLGGGAFVNEVDGNLTCAISDSAIEVHWQGKFRGPDFPPLSFLVKTVTHQDLKDSKGRLIPTVIAESLSEVAQEDMARSARYNEDQLLAEIDHSPNASLTDLAKALQWFARDGSPYKMQVKRAAAKLLAAKLITQERDGYAITEKGRKAPKKGNGDDRPKDAAKNSPKELFQKLGPAPKGCDCAECHSYDPPIYRIKDARYPRGEVAMLHEGCAKNWFQPGH
jgi:hypothetical protein